MFVEYITLDHTRACIAEPGKIVVVGRPSRSIDAVLPLLNAMLPNVVSFSPRASALVLRRKPGFITLLADTIYITQVKDADEGLELLAAAALDTGIFFCIFRPRSTPLINRHKESGG